MKRIYNILTIALMAFASSCNDYLETKPGDKYDDVAVWSDQTLAESFVFNIYMGIPYPFQWYVNASLVDEAIPVQNDGVVTRVLTSTMTPDDKGVFVDNWAYAMNNWWWNDLFSCIRACNLFFEKVSDIPFTTEKYRDRLVGEVHFLRGYFYYLLLAQYGGVPLLDYTFNIGDDYNVPRNTLKETVDFIVKDLDQAAGLLRESQPADKTRATEGAALALKSRVLLYAASDLFNSKASWSPGYSNPELVSYTDDNRQQRWEAVRQATEAVMNLGYKLYDADADRVTNFANIFLKNSDEQIFITKYDKINFPEYWGTDWVMIYEPGTFGGYSLNQVTGNLANAFENADGTDFDFAVQSDAPYLNRDPRFYATILSEGTEWKYPDWNYWAMMPYTVHCGRWVNADGATVSIGGDYYSGGANTGYYIRKFIDSDVFQYYYGDRQHHPYIQIRYAEVLLNYAEACIALGREDDARSAINQLRKRAGMPDITDTGEALVGRYRNERRVELAWEQHRFFDVRRWMIASEAYVPAKGVDIIYPVEGSTDNPVYKETVVEQRAWNVSHYLVPIGRNEMQKNQALIQNPGYN